MDWTQFVMIAVPLVAATGFAVAWWKWGTD
jgi:hypothetical protein